LLKHTLENLLLSISPDRVATVYIQSMTAKFPTEWLKQ